MIDAACEGSTKDRFEKFMRSTPVRGLMNRRRAETCSADFLAVFAHPRAGVSTNVQLRILHNRALDLEWLSQATRALARYWQGRNGRKKSSQHLASLDAAA